MPTNDALPPAPQPAPAPAPQPGASDPEWYRQEVARNRTLRQEAEKQAAAATALAAERAAEATNWQRKYALLQHGVKPGIKERAAVREYEAVVKEAGDKAPEIDAWLKQMKEDPDAADWFAAPPAPAPAPAPNPAPAPATPAKPPPKAPNVDAGVVTHTRQPLDADEKAVQLHAAGKLTGEALYNEFIRDNASPETASQLSRWHPAK